jgi:2-polyprenyl-6-methoxyphenol hydroxylase-like FAD-dependent oxidoreductase
MPDGSVIARFEDGSSADGNVLVGADGAASRVRRQLLPDAQRIDTGVVMVSGKFPLDDAVRRQTPAPVFKGPTLIVGPRGCCMFTGAVEYPSAHLAAYDRDEYVMWGFSTHRDRFGLTDTTADVVLPDARDAVLAQMPDWSPDLRRLVERAEASSLTSIAVKSSVPVPRWETQSVTASGRRPA